MSQPFNLGVNYWPRRKAMYWWSAFDAGEVRDEFALIRSLGMTLVRVFLLWDDFQPTPDAVSPQRLRDLVTVADIAAESGLQLDVTFFTGHMSGPNWAPRWLLDKNLKPPLQVISQGVEVKSGYRNSFTDPLAMEAERVQLRAVVGVLKDHPGVAMWNLGNEPDLFAHPPTAAAGRAWVRQMTQLIKSLDPLHPVTCGLHAASLFGDCGFRVDDVFGETDFGVMHIYPMYLGKSVAPLDPDVVPFSCALVRALCGKPVLMEEFGGCTVAPGQPTQTWKWRGFAGERSQFMASEDDFAAYIAQVLPRLLDVGATGALVWCFADYAEELWNKAPCDFQRHERHFGLVRPDGSLKPHAKVIRAFAATSPTVQGTPKRALPRVDGDAFYRDPAKRTFDLYREWLRSA